MNQLNELLSELTPAVAALLINQQKADEHISKLIETQTMANVAISELRQSNMRLASAIEKLVVKIDKVDEFESRLKKLEEEWAHSLRS